MSPSGTRADDPVPHEEPLSEPTEEVRPPDRPLPDYSGLPPSRDVPGEVLSTTARVLTSPFYFVSEFVLRRPIGWAATEIERHHVISELRDFFTFGPDDNIAVFPTFFYELGFQPNVGLYAVWNELFIPENRLSTQAGFGGTDWLSFAIADRIELGERLHLGVRFLARERPDYVFGGIGPNATDLPRARFGAQRIEASMWSTTRFWKSSDLEFEARYRSIGFIDEGWDEEPSVGQRAQETGQPLPFGFQTGYEAVSTTVRVDVDTRTPDAPPEGGLRLAAYVGQHGAFGGLPALERWISWGGSTTLATDVLGGHRVLGITGIAQLITPLHGSNVPFTELVDLGGSEGVLHGYRPGHVQGLSTIGLTAHYTWPIWAFLDAHLYLGTANAFGRHLEDFDVGLLRLTFGIQFLPRVGDADLPFRFDLAFATDTFDDGTSIDSFRLAVGARDEL